MSGGVSGVFSAQAILISLALHIVIVGGLYSFGTSGEKSPANDVSVVKPEIARPEVAEPEKSPVEKPKAEPSPEPKKVATESAEAKPQPEKPKVKPAAPKVNPDDKPAQIRIEPRQDDKLESDVSAKRAEAPAKKDDPPPAKDKPASGKTKVYVVKRGDTLTALAKECGLTVGELAALNGKSVKKLSNLWVGQKIKLPAAE